MPSERHFPVANRRTCRDPYPNIIVSLGILWKEGLGIVRSRGFVGKQENGVHKMNRARLIVA